jgi:hypothetical protein
MRPSNTEIIERAPLGERELFPVELPERKN